MDGTTMQLIQSLSTSYSLSASSGIRSSIPLVIYSFVAWLFPELAPVSDNMKWMATWWFFALCCVWLIVEVVADKVPAVDHVLHAAGVPIHIVVAVILALGPQRTAHVRVAAQVPVTVLGIGSALTFHGSKAGVRALSSVCSSGVCNCAISTVEDVLVVIVVLLIVFVAVVSVAIAGLLLALTFVFCCWCGSRQYRKRAERQQRDLEAPLIVMDGSAPFEHHSSNPYFVKLGTHE